MKIERIDYINLDRRPDRNTFFRKHLEILGTDMSIVHRFSGYDVRDFRGIDDFRSEAKKDFPRVVRVNRIPAGNLGYLWSIRSVLHIIQKSRCISMMFSDDNYIRHPLSDFNDLLKKIPSEHFKCLQLHWCDVEKCGEEILLHAKNQKTLLGCPEIYRNFRSAGENINILSPAGATLFLQEMDKMPASNLEAVIGKGLLPRNIPGCYSIVNRREWLGSPIKRSESITKSDKDPLNDTYSR